jgi:hypothetical protein
VSRKTHVHDYVLPREGRPNVLYRHKIKANVCGTHPVAVPWICWCEPEVTPNVSMSTREVHVFNVIHQNKSRDEVQRECLHG